MSMNRIKEFRQNAGLSQPQLVKILKCAGQKIDPASLSRIESGLFLPNAALLMALETALGVSRKELYEPESLSVVDELSEFEAPTEDVLRLVNLIPVSKPISRHELRQKFGTADRAMRIAIEKARLCGVIIINLSDGRGYRASTVDDEAYAFYKQENSRADNIKKSIQPLKIQLAAGGYRV